MNPIPLLKSLFRLLPHVIYAGAFVVVGFYTNHSVRLTRIQEAKVSVNLAAYEAQKAESESVAAQFKAINQYWALEAERTDVEKAMKRAVMAELKVQAVCKRVKGRC